MNINEFLVKRFHVSKEEAGKWISENRVFINHQKAVQRNTVLKTDVIELNGEILQEGLTHCYYAYYKPRGIECTLNPNIADNLLNVLPFKEYLYPIGRLDKESEGLLILTNDGKLYKDIAHAEKEKEKEYVVEVDKELTDAAIEQLAAGIVIMGKKTRPAVVHRLSSTSFNITLTQGLNRQIRRMCHKLGYEVSSLKRIRITSILLGDLKPGEYLQIQKKMFDK
ncbi:RNA pseudouridine synthase [uncultured Cytophaga sp.]|uniref:RNA pseudouridine synthase n=1 Tax=uncultured Cytophaga sp. TaxID=160238 RepID=UPI0026144A3E|nr:RNA pseudouridine synthase [uncultured Cytophaga sp.]